jgi:hypothetical protein
LHLRATGVQCAPIFLAESTAWTLSGFPA